MISLCKKTFFFTAWISQHVICLFSEEKKILKEPVFVHDYIIKRPNYLRNHPHVPSKIRTRFINLNNVRFEMRKGPIWAGLSFFFTKTQLGSHPYTGGKTRCFMKSFTEAYRFENQDKTFDKSMTKRQIQVIHFEKRTTWRKSKTSSPRLW